jgi:hypothetical protein
LFGLGVEEQEEEELFVYIREGARRERADENLNSKKFLMVERTQTPSATPAIRVGLGFRV